jgi:hypothetical protein
MKQYSKAEHVLTESILPSRRYVPRRCLKRFDELLTSVNELLPVKRQETIERRRAIQLLDESYFPSL